MVVVEEKDIVEIMAILNGAKAKALEIHTEPYASGMVRGIEFAQQLLRDKLRRLAQ